MKEQRGIDTWFFKVIDPKLVREAGGARLFAKDQFPSLRARGFGPRERELAGALGRARGRDVAQGRQRMQGVRARPQNAQVARAKTAVSKGSLKFRWKARSETTRSPNDRRRGRWEEGGVGLLRLRSRRAEGSRRTDPCL